MVCLNQSIPLHAMDFFEIFSGMIKTSIAAAFSNNQLVSGLMVLCFQ